MPQLILTADPDFLDLALAEAQRAATEVTQVAQLAPGIVLLDCVEGFWAWSNPGDRSRLSSSVTSTRWT
ncbi:MAG: hypothetical protein R2856_07425 [Caldilineaceae bacterium]